MTRGNQRLCLDVSRGQVPSRYHSALMHHQLGDYRKAIAQLDAVMGDAGDERRVREARGLSYQAVGDHTKAVQVRTPLGSHAPLLVPPPPPHTHHTRMLGGGLEQDFTAAIKCDDSRGEPYYCRAVSLLALGRANSCVKDLGSALDLGWVRPEVFDARATAYVGCRWSLHQGVDLDPSHPSVPCSVHQLLVAGHVHRSYHGLHGSRTDGTR